MAREYDHLFKLLIIGDSGKGAATGPWRVGGGVWSRCQRRGHRSSHHHEVMSDRVTAIHRWGRWSGTFTEVLLD